MADLTHPEPKRLPTATASEFVATFALMLVAVVVLVVVDAWLANVDRSESKAHAANLYYDGQRLLALGRPDAAGDKFADAVAADRSRPEYELGLAEAFLAGGHLEEAQKTVQSVLDRAQTDGAANLLMARILIRQNRLEIAKSYYHRAIYGRWPGNAAVRRMNARLELVNLLARTNAREELLAELLPIEAASPDNPELRRRLAHLFIRAGSPANGVEIFRALLQQNSEDADAYAGMGEAALALGNFRTARADLAIAADLQPDNAGITRNLQLADSVLALDPLQRGASVDERMARSRRLLALSLEVAARCPGNSPAPTRIVDSARTEILTPPEKPTEAAVDANVSVATALWASADPACRSAGSVTSRALAIVQGKLAQ